MTHNNSYEDSRNPAFVLGRAIPDEGERSEDRLACAGVNCIVKCTCASGWSDSATGTAGLDYTSRTSAEAYALVGGSLSSVRSFAAGPQHKTCYHTCSYTPSGSCPAGYTEGLTGCDTGYKYTSTTITRTYTGSPDGCSKSSETITCGKCELDKCPDGYFKNELSHDNAFIYTTLVDRPDCEKISGCALGYTTSNNGASHLGLYREAHGVKCYNVINNWSIDLSIDTSSIGTRLTCTRKANCYKGHPVDRATITHTVGSNQLGSGIDADCTQSQTFSSSETFYANSGKTCAMPDSCVVAIDGKLYSEGDILGVSNGKVFVPNGSDASTRATSYYKIICGASEVGGFFDVTFDFTASAGCSNLILKATPSIQVTLDRTKKTKTAHSGTITFTNVSAGSHTLSGSASIYVENKNVATPTPYACAESTQSALSFSKNITVSPTSTNFSFDFSCCASTFDLN